MTEIDMVVESYYVVRASIPAVRKSEFETNCEIVWVKFLTSSSPLLFGVFYRPPDSPLSALEELNCSSSSISSDIPLLLCGAR